MKNVCLIGLNWIFDLELDRGASIFVEQPAAASILFIGIEEKKLFL